MLGQNSLLQTETLFSTKKTARKTLKIITKIKNENAPESETDKIRPAPGSFRARRKASAFGKKALFLAGLSTGGCDVGNPLVGIGLAQALFENFRSAFNQSLGFAKSEVCKSLNGLDNANLLGGVE